MTPAERAKKQRDVYIWNAIRRLEEIVDPYEKRAYEKMFPCERALTIAEHILKHRGIQRHNSIYDDCISDSFEVYLYTILRCSHMRYSHVENYFRFMVKIVIIWNWSISRELMEYCRKERLKLINIDSTAGYSV